MLGGQASAGGGDVPWGKERCGEYGDAGLLDPVFTNQVGTRRDATLRQTLVTEILGGLPVVRHPASYFAWLPLADEVRADRIAMALMREGIAVSTAEPFSTSVHVPHAIRLALGSVDLNTLREALVKVKRVVDQYDYSSP